MILPTLKCSYSKGKKDFSFKLFLNARHSTKVVLERMERVSARSYNCTARVQQNLDFGVMGSQRVETVEFKGRANIHTAPTNLV